METVNLSRAVLVCNTFHFCFAAAKASLMPFMAIFCRMMGLTATETGIIMAIKTATGFIWAPLWSRCAIAYNKRRSVLMFSIFIMAATYLSLSVVFSQVKDQEELCRPLQNDYDNKSNINGSMLTTAPNHPSTTLTMSNSSLGDIVTKPSTILTETTEAAATSPPTTKAATTPPTTTKAPTTIKTTPLTTTPPLTTTTILTTVHTTEKSSTNQTMTPLHTAERQDSEKQIVSVIKNMLKTRGYTTQFIKENNLNADELFTVINNIYPNSGLTEEYFRKLWPLILNSEEGSEDSGRTRRDIHDSWNTVKNKMAGLLSKIEEKKMQVFAIIIAIIVFGEFFCSPVEKVADDSWFDFLDRVDDLEKYGKQRLSGSLAFILLPVAVTVAVDYTECLVPFHNHHFLIHFYVYGFFLGLAFLIAFFYPVPPPHKQKNKSKVVKGLQIVCCDCRGFLYVVTLLIMGMTYASVHVFLFWVIQDKGGNEVNMGLCVSIGALAEILMLMFSGKMVNKIGNAGVVTVSLLAMTARTLYYSFLQVPWAVLPGELTHAFTHTAMWYAVLSYDEFNVGPGIDRSIRSVLSSFYFGVGFTLGSVGSGVFYDLFGSSVMYWAGGVLTGVWAMVFLIISLCLPKKEKIRYVRLLQNDNPEDSDVDADDWLEMALKDQ